jgi:hypothetical protein
MTIIVHQRPIEETRTGSKSCRWVGEAIVNGRTYTATSRMAPANDFACQLVADGVPDEPMQIYSAGLYLDAHVSLAGVKQKIKKLPWTSLYHSTAFPVGLAPLGFTICQSSTSCQRSPTLTW